MKVFDRLHDEFEKGRRFEERDEFFLAVVTPAEWKDHGESLGGAFKKLGFIPFAGSAGGAEPGYCTISDTWVL